MLIVMDIGNPAGNMSTDLGTITTRTETRRLSFTHNMWCQEREM